MISLSQVHEIHVVTPAGDSWQADGWPRSPSCIRGRQFVAASESAAALAVGLTVPWYWSWTLPRWIRELRVDLKRAGIDTAKCSVQIVARVNRSDSRACNGYVAIFTKPVSECAAAA